MNIIVLKLRNYSSFKQLIILSFSQVSNLINGASSGPNEVWKSILSEFPKASNFNLRKLEKFDVVWIPSGQLFEMSDRIEKALLNKVVLFGPNIHFENTKNQNCLKKFKNYFVISPSVWVTNYFNLDFDFPKLKIITWAAGIDEEFWNCTQPKQKSICVYVKGILENNEIGRIQDYVESHGYRVDLVTYGKYSQSEYKSILARSCGAIFLGGTESQGLAMFQAWAMNVPTLVQNAEEFKNIAGKIFRASPSPYLTPLTGIIAQQNLSQQEIENFLLNLDKFSPRDWITNFATSKIAAQNLKNSLERATEFGIVN